MCFIESSFGSWLYVDRIFSSSRKAASVRQDDVCAARRVLSWRWVERTQVGHQHPASCRAVLVLACRRPDENYHPPKIEPALLALGNRMFSPGCSKTKATKGRCSLGRRCSASMRLLVAEHGWWWVLMQ